jgi:AcrR family transcriptional regulator
MTAHERGSDRGFISYWKEINVSTFGLMGRPRDVTDEAIVEAARRCFLERGVHIAVKVVAEELGVSHTTIFNRFHTKEALLLAALGPPQTLPFAATLASGPDARDVPTQLRELCRALVDYFERLGSGWTALQSAGISLDKVFAGRSRPSPLEAHDALTSFLRRARRRGLLGPCDASVLAWTLLGALHYRVFQASVPGSGVRRCSDREIEAMVEMLWSGAAPNAHSPAPARSKTTSSKPAARPSTAAKTSARRAPVRSR